jgi:hypothetical protein
MAWSNLGSEQTIQIKITNHLGTWVSSIAGLGTDHDEVDER